jgi:hypothetical protein
MDWNIYGMRSCKILWNFNKWRLSWIIYTTTFQPIIFRIFPLPPPRVVCIFHLDGGTQIYDPLNVTASMGNVQLGLPTGLHALGNRAVLIGYMAYFVGAYRSGLMQTSLNCQNIKFIRLGIFGIIHRIQHHCKYD